ncbi:2-oxo acid dehydrogenase subunit E2 [Acetobacterium woodii]|uniref:Pyruvate dehydrogenase E2 component, dihydrolipoyllysine-residue acetyltransferase PdhC3 n=1 Tax=Acetobacterium woodii (strain ATCC 29683 / DSM 1030 / JCM 2381 / KCTC 1655 / WB1) TaxID=931626 RepID=H6LHI4_ACEWD|nr:2-oxo acid dehydrogenase subunit E2 [Acetobacterium woodii]AFA49694.1 pyruvate dehydrogenase E2 component, dihydrolipoyllysine-residue acetyltransferase PdhC3 [Acetobacterium woodii DSM 1030]
MENEILLSKEETAMDNAAEIEINPMTNESGEVIPKSGAETLKQEAEVLIEAAEVLIQKASETEPKEKESLNGEQLDETMAPEELPEENLEAKLVAVLDELERNLEETINQGPKQHEIKGIINDVELETAPEEIAEPDPREGKVRATPAARRIAREFKVDIKKAVGTGQNGRIEADDVKKMVVILPGKFSYKSKEPVVIGTDLDRIHGNPKNRFSRPTKLEELPNKKVKPAKKLKAMNPKIEKVPNPDLDFVPFVDETTEKLENHDAEVVTKISELDFVPFVDVKAEPLRDEIIVKPTPMHALDKTNWEMFIAAENQLTEPETKQAETAKPAMTAPEADVIAAKVTKPEVVEPTVVEAPELEPVMAEVEVAEAEVAQADVVESAAAEIEVVETEAVKAERPKTGEAKVTEQKNDRIEAEQVKLIAETTTVTLTAEIDMTEIKELRKKITKKIEDQVKYRCTYTDFLLLATSRALVKHPLINARLEENAVVTQAYVNLGLTVESDRGRLIPVINNTQEMSFVEMVKSRGDLIKKVKNKQLLKEQLKGSTFTITNLGMYGISEFTALINRPNCAILSVGEVVQRIRVNQGEPVVRSVMKISLNLDHRVADSADGAKFIQDIKADMENPSLLLF